MDILYLLIPLSLLLVFVIAALFWWSLKSGQYEDLEGPGYRILMDDDKPEVSVDVVATDASTGAGVAKPSEPTKKQAS
jgi:cbb3-type cytochrome oxidase maturation protein